MPDLPLQGCLPGVLHLTMNVPPSHHSAQHDPCLLLGFWLVLIVAQLLQTSHTDQGGEKLRLYLGGQSLSLLWLVATRTHSMEYNYTGIVVVVWCRAGAGQRRHQSS